MCFLPEAFAFLDTKMKDEDYEAIDGNFMKALRETARNKNIWLSLGGFIRKVDG